MTRVYNTKTGKWWSWTFSAKWAAEEAIKRGHPHNTDHLVALDEYEEDMERVLSRGFENPLTETPGGLK